MPGEMGGVNEGLGERAYGRARERRERKEGRQGGMPGCHGVKAAEAEDLKTKLRQKRGHQEPT